LIADSVAGQARVPHAARRILKDALALRDERDEDVIDAEEFGLLMATAQRSRQPAASALITLPARASPTSLAA
jgi:hypothetical protein